MRRSYQDRTWTDIYQKRQQEMQTELDTLAAELAALKDKHRETAVGQCKAEAAYIERQNALEAALTEMAGIYYFHKRLLDAANAILRRLGLPDFIKPTQPETSQWTCACLVVNTADTCEECGRRRPQAETDCGHGQIVQTGCPICERKLGREAPAKPYKCPRCQRPIDGDDILGSCANTRDGSHRRMRRAVKP
jgi:hypothetical protein